MDSYQEVAYNISNSNRGYIFLISSAKFIFLAIAAAFSINYCANYLAELSLLGANVDNMTSGKIYGIYLGWVLFTSGVVYFFYHRLLASQKWNSLVSYANLFSLCFVMQFIVVFVTMLVAVALPESSIK